MKRKLPNSKGVYLERDILSSESFFALSGSAIRLFLIFRMKCVIKMIKSRNRDGKVIVNNGEIQFTYIEAKKKYNISKTTFRNARDKLIEVGLIEIEHEGGCHLPTLYSISKNWRKYPEEEFTRKKSANLVGKDTRWKTKDTVKRGTI